MKIYGHGFTIDLSRFFELDQKEFEKEYGPLNTDIEYAIKTKVHEILIKGEYLAIELTYFKNEIEPSFKEIIT